MTTPLTITLTVGSMIRWSITIGLIVWANLEADGYTGMFKGDLSWVVIIVLWGGYWIARLLG